MIKDEWEILDVNDQVIGLIGEDDMVLALIRRFATNLVPQHFSASIGGKVVWDFKQLFNFFVSRITLDMSLEY